MKRFGLALAAVLVAASLASVTYADWILTPYKAGSTSLTSVNVNPGDNFAVDFRITQAPGDTSTGVLQSMIFDVNFSVGGLEYTGYTLNGLPWAFDGSIPAAGSFPVTVSAGSTSAHLEGMTFSGFTLPGALVTLNFHVPNSFSAPNVLLTPIPSVGDFTDTNADPITTVSGGSFNVITNVPEPSTVAMLISGGVVGLGYGAIRRRKKNQAAA